MNSCFHCHEQIPKNVKIHAEIDGVPQAMCCYGCKAVAEFINKEGYCEFYDYRGDSEPLLKAQVAAEKWRQYDEDINFNSYCKATSDNSYKVSIFVEGMYCSACGWLLDKYLKQQLGIQQVKLNTITKILQVEFDLSDIKLSQILTAINYLGYQPILNKGQDKGYLNTQERKLALKRLIVAGFGMMFIMTLSVPLYSADYSGIDPTIRRFFSLVSLLVATGVFFYSGVSFLNNAYRDLRNRHLGMDVPVALSISLAYGVSSWNVLSANGATIYFDSMVMFVFFLLAGRYVEMTVRHQGMSANDALESMIPNSVAVLNNGHIKTVPIDSLVKGDVINVESGGTIAIDGEVIHGQASINESLITGESQSVKRNVGDMVMAGTVLDSGSVQIKSTAIGDETLLAGLSELLQKAQLQKPETLQLVDKIASWFVAIVLLLAAATATYYSIYQADKTLITVLAVLVATCPCALSLATPAALTAASVSLMKQGILINNLDAISKITKIKYWFFDKTGTLTEAHMSISGITNFSHLSGAELLKYAAALEHHSSHPLASAFNDYYDEQISVKQYHELANKGIAARINNDLWKIGTHKWCELDAAQRINSQHSVIYLSKNKQLMAVFELQNKMRQGTLQLIQYLQKQHKNISIISGDKTTVVEAIAKALNIKQFFAEQTPEQKINTIHQHQSQAHATVMVGDGINDAPVLAQSDVSISFNQGTQLARSASDLIVMGNSLQSIIKLLAISQKTNNIIRQNIIWALVYNLSVTPLAIMGYLSPWMAAIGMSVSSLFVVLNAKRILLH
ncbi:MAG TPA: cadmium-translocating P-type ATPase [Oceanospirillales bacterium]|nr:cadmium-translocating P-type ATPase [Oceanospirillales bacterium]